MKMEEKQNKSKEKETTIIVNTREKIWNQKEISYRQVVELAFDSYSDDPNIVYEITFSKGDDSRREGTLVKGSSVRVKKGMIFNVTRSDKS